METSMDRPGHVDQRNHVQPLSGLRVSWGTIFAGAVATLAVSLIIWALLFAVIASITKTSPQNLANAATAIWICGVIATWIGTFVAGLLSGYLPGSPRMSVGLTHAFLAWGFAFVVVSFVQFGILGNLAAMTGGPVSGQVMATDIGHPGLAQGVANLFAALGVSPTVAAGVRGTMPGVPSGWNALEHGRMLAASLTWIWFITWFVGLGFSLLGGSFSVNRLRRGPVSVAERRVREPEGYQPLPGPA